ncbi:unnamed protein product [Pleuronectes platessa]|uniref:Uncharacterized protein n=1 Tax=Pleuronectes platessa TaxID=8262 RepID=A0A9N7V519_PLEPL|nr:unnamed protein product [Pleuronectes platessa]
MRYISPPAVPPTVGLTAPEQGTLLPQHLLPRALYMMIQSIAECKSLISLVIGAAPLLHFCECVSARFKEPRPDVTALHKLPRKCGMIQQCLEVPGQTRRGT